MKGQVQPLTPVALYARVSSDRQDVDLSVAAQLRALRDYARNNGYTVAREYVDEAESGRIADRPQFRQMIDEGGKATAPFQVILVWKFSRFTRKREHAVAFKSMLRHKGVADERLALGERPFLQELSEVRHVPLYLLGGWQLHPALLKLSGGVLTRSLKLLLPVPQREYAGRRV